MIYTNSTAIPRQELTDVVMEGVGNFDQFVGLALFPPLGVDGTQGHFPKITISKGELARATTRRRSPGTNFDRWNSSIEDGTFTLEQIAEEVQIPDEHSFHYRDILALETFYAREAENRLRRGHEIQVADTLFDTGNFAATAAGVAYTEANIATLDPILDIDLAIERVSARGEHADTVVIPGPVWARIRRGTLVRNYLTGSINPGATVTLQTLSSALAAQGITKVLIARGYVNRSDMPDSTDGVEPIWPNTYIWVGNTSGTGELENGGVGRTLYWLPEGELMNVSTYRDEPKKSDIVRGMMTSGLVIANTRRGTLITTNYS